MSEIKSELELKLEEIEQSLSQVTDVEDGITKLKQIEQLLVNVKMEDIYNMKDLIIKHLKPVTRDITNISMRDLPNASRQILQQLTFAIVTLYAKAARFRFEILPFELLPELLDRRADLFRTNVGRSDKFLTEEQEKALYQSVQSDWIMRKTMSKQQNTPFYYKCLTLIMTTMEGVQKQFTVSGLNFVKEYINFLIKMSTYLNINKLTDHVEKILESLQNMMENNPASKQFNLDTIKLMFNSQSRLCNICMKGDLRKRFEMLGSIYGLGMLGSPSIQKKINGIKLINKQAEGFYRGNRFVKQQQYINWLYGNKIIDMILQQSSQSPILKHCNYIFRILFKKHCLNTTNSQKIFDYIEQANSENRQIVLKNLDLESIRLEYYDYQLLVNFIKKPFKPDFYEEDLFSICSQCIRYSTTNLLKEFIAELSKILQNNVGKFRNEKIQQKCLKCFVKAIVRLLDKDLNNETKKSEFLKLYDHYFEKQFTNLGIMVFKAIFDELPEISEISACKAASALISNKSVIQNGLRAMKNSNTYLYANIQQFLCLLLRKAGDVYGSQKIEFTPKIFLQAVHSPKMFQKLSTFVPYSSQQLLETFESLLSMFNVQNIPFECVKSIFLRMNFIYIRQVRQYNQEYRFEILGKVTSLKGVDSLKYLLMSASNAENRSAIAAFIADIYTNFSQSRVAEAEIELEKMLQQTLKMTLSQYKSKQSAQKLLGSLALVEAFMMGTQTLGVGKYRPHNSLVPISTVQIKVMNDITYGNDVAQSYWKKVSSNLTLFDLLQEMCEKFRCSACEISLQEGQKFWSQKWNGLTLQEAKIDDKLLKAVKSSKQRIRKQKLIQNGQLTPKTKKVFEQIYKSYATEGKMGKKQCANFVAGVTKTSSSIHDARVIQFFREYDLDQDQNITLEDFLRFYLYHCAPERQEIVWKNLNNMRYRKDLKKYDDPVQITNQNLLFRSILSKSIEFYEMLFSLSQQKNEELKQISIKLLLRLPTFSKTLQSLRSQLDLISKNCFQTQYLLIAVQSKLAIKNQQQMSNSSINHQEFIESGNSIKIFEMMLRIDKMENATKDQMKCLYISLQILRSLIKVPDLRTIITAQTSLNVNISFPETYLFIKLAENALKNIEIDILQASLALQMSQKQKKIEFALQGIFHQQLGIRKTCCNYVLALYLQGNVSIDLFTIEQKTNCEYWFETLAKICTIDSNIDFSKVVFNCLEKIRNRSETIQGNQDDPIIFGNLSIVSSVLHQKSKDYDDISSDIIQISQRVLSNRSRRLIYQILAHFDVNFAIQYVTSLIDNITPVKQVEPKKYFVGIKNLGSTCYMNSVLQVLFCVNQFRNLVLYLDKSQKQMTDVKGKLIYDDTLYQLQVMYTNLLRSSRKFYIPQQFCMTIKQNGSSTEPIDPKVQEDAHEFVGKFLDKLEKEIEKTDKIQYFRKLIEGNTVTQVLCKKCSNKISREQKFCQLSLAVQGNKNLQQSFQNYIKPEEIEDYFCTNCNCKVQKIQKSTLLQKLPKLLTINLQRIIFDLQNFVNKKIDTTFEFPVNLNVINYVNKESGLSPQECQYVIKAIIVHSGTSQSGHYYSFIRVDKDWYKFNDQTVTKIEYKDIPHECFGGSESKQQWTDDMKFSTNAYMLFYESKNQQLETIPCSLDEQQVQKIQIDNQKFYKQAQIHQQSVFLFANELFERFVPRDIQQRMKFSTHDQGWNDDPNLSYYQAIFQFSIKVLKFSTIFYDIKSEYVFKIGQNLFKLFFLLPEKSYSFLTSLSPDEVIDNLCIHNDDTIRSIYKYLMNKSLHVFICYYQVSIDSEQEGTVKVIKLIDTLFAFLQDERFDKNIGKCFHYLDFWKTCCEFMPIIVDYLIDHQALVILVDRLMGNDSPIADKKKKRVEISQYVVTPIIQIVVYLMSRKKNIKGYINPLKVFENIKYYDLTENQRILLGNTEFYSKMINKRYDTGQLGLVTARLSEKDFEFSKQIGGLYLKGLNNASNSDSAIIILHHIQHYLQLDDELTSDRIKWILGIPQLHMGDQLVYGLAYEDESVAYDYVSPLFFVKSAQKQQNKSALSIMYENHSTFSDFSVKGVALLLDLMCTSMKVFDYVMSIPAPTYMFRSYLDWIEKYIRCFKDSYVMEDRISEKINLIEKMNEMYKHLSERIATSDIVLPVNKNIIGRNKELSAIESMYDENYKMTLWAHKTYILKNEPLILCNGSLPKELFKFGHPQGIAKYFISMDKFSELIDSEDIASEYTVYTLEIDSKQLLKLDIKLDMFKQEINVHKGKIFINFPYKEINGGLKQVVDVTVIKKEEQIQMVEKMEKQDIEATDKELLDYYAAQSKPTIICKQCTYINKADERFCDMCMNALY